MATTELLIKRGKTFSLPLRWEMQEDIVYRPITAIAQTAPVRITCPLHGVPNGWRVAVNSVKGMTEINSEANAVKDKDYRPATVVDPNTIEINAINALNFKPYTSGGVVQYNKPVDLAGFLARLTIRDKVGGVELMKLDSALIGGIVLDAVARTITITIDATVTAALAWKKGVFDLELVSGTGVVTEVMAGTVTVSNEVTT